MSDLEGDVDAIGDPRIDLPGHLRAWVEEASGARVVAAERHLAGASREAWSVDVAAEEADRYGSEPAVEMASNVAFSERLFLLRDKGQGGGSARDAAVLRALEGTTVPVPRVVAASSERSALLLERLPGRSDFPSVDRESDREPTARHLMELTAKLHSLDIGGLDLPHLTRPEIPEDCARMSLDQVKRACSTLGAGADPFFEFALGWLDANVPTGATQYALVHSDMGPGNFLFADGRVTGIVDWEVAHYGDPMEDLAAIAIRDMATPVGDLPTRFAEYAMFSSNPVDLARVHYYRALVLVRNSLMIGLGLAHPAEGFNVPEMTMYQTLLMRGAALVICDNLHLARPGANESLSGDDADEFGALHLPARNASERADAAKYFARRFHRLAESRRTLMGALYDRLPQPLEPEEHLEPATPLESPGGKA